MEDKGIDISDLEKGEVLAALYNASKPQGLGFLHYDSSPMTKEEAEEIIRQGTRFDYLKGRVMKVDLSKNTFNPWGFDRDNGAGAAQEAISQLRDTKNPNSDLIQKRHKEKTLSSAMQVEENLNTASALEKSDDGVVTMRLGLKEFTSELGPKVKNVIELNPN